MTTTLQKTLPLRATAAGLLSFVLVGGSQALYGPSLPGLTAVYDLPSGVAGLTVSLHNAGALLGVLSALPLEGHPLARWRAGLALLLMGSGAVLIASGLSWPLTLVGAFVIGLAYGGLTIGINSLFAVGFGPRSPGMVNLLNAIFGLGAIITPLLTWFYPAQPQRVFWALALGCGLLLPLGLLLDDRTPTAVDPAAANRPAQRRLLLLFMLFLAIGGGIEASTVGFAATYLVATGLTAGQAATVTSLFFVALTLARLVAIPLSLRFSPPQLVLGSLGVTLILLAGALFPSLAPVTLSLAGASIAFFFPNCFNWLSRVFNSAGSTALVISGVLLGGVLLPAGMAWIIGRWGELTIIPTLLVASAALIALGGVLLRRLKASGVHT